MENIETLNALYFIKFHSVNSEAQVVKIMLEKGISIKYSLERFMLELDKIRKIIIANGKEVISEITKKQRGIIEKLNLELGYVPKK